MVDQEQTPSINNRGDFGLWAIERAKEIMGGEASGQAFQARDGDDAERRAAGNALGQAITDALLEVHDGLLDGVE